jgi:hypothetical protein
MLSNEPGLLPPSGDHRTAEPVKEPYGHPCDPYPDDLPPGRALAGGSLTGRIEIEVIALVLCSATSAESQCRVVLQMSPGMQESALHVQLRR